jgi:RNA polymerase sigma-70 factor, ECF subfamily
MTQQEPPGGRDGADPVFPPSAAAEADALGQLADSDILSALRGLPEGLRVTVYLADIEGYGYRDIAEMTGTPIGTVAARLHRGRARLRAKLGRRAARAGLAPLTG